MKHTQKKKFPLFYKIYFIIIALVVAASVIGLWWLWGVLRDYEDSQPKHVADAIFEKYYTSGDFTALAAKCAEGNPFESASAVAKYLNENYKDAEMTCTSGAMKNGLPTYIVKVGDYKVSSFTLKEKEKNSRGWEMFEEGTFEVYYGTSALTVIVPTGYSVAIDGIPLDDSYVTERAIPSPEAEYLPEGVTGITYVKYEVRGLLEDPDVRVTGTDGRAAQVSYDEKDKAYHTYPLFDEKLKEEQSDYVIEAISKYTLMMSADQYWGNVKKYFDPDSSIYEDTYESAQYTWTVIDHDSAQITDAEASRFLRYSDNVFACRVTMTNILTKGTQTFRDPVDWTVIFRNVNGEWLICGMINNS
jgi:hypothetical protein